MGEKKPKKPKKLKKDKKMAITWELKPVILNKEKNIVSITAIRLDDADPDNPVTYHVSKAVLSSIPSDNIWILDEIWNKHEAALLEDSEKLDYLADLIAAGKTNLEARE